MLAYHPDFSQDIWNKTWYPKAADHPNISKPWYVVDASDKILGRLASTIAVHIRGKNLETYTPSVDMGAFVIVVSMVDTKFCLCNFSPPLSSLESLIEHALKVAPYLTV